MTGGLFCNLLISRIFVSPACQTVAMLSSSHLASDLEAAIALSRFGLGSTVEGVDAIGGRARNQLHDEIDAGPPPLLHPAADRTAAELIGLQKAYLRNLREARAVGVRPMSAPAPEVYYDELDARFNLALMQAPIGFRERLVMFWANHFAVAVDKSHTVQITAGAFEREAIRPNIFGRFKDLLLAAETHPAMLAYLDNQVSTGPNSRAGMAGKGGLNENLAREIMELHVLGVDSGYTQADVTAFAKSLTGWTIDSEDGFVFSEQRHEPGARQILGRRYAEDGFFQAADIMLDLAERPAAARFIATKLARHFVADEPPPELVDRLADVFRATDGDLAAVSHTLIEAPEAWRTDSPKLRTPQEHVVAMLRATGVTLRPKVVHDLLMAMGQRPWQPSGPNGFPDTFAPWATAPGFNARLDAAQRIASRMGDRMDPRDVAETRLGARLTPQTYEAVARAESPHQGLALVFMSPEFMRR